MVRPLPRQGSQMSFDTHSQSNKQRNLTTNIYWTLHFHCLGYNAESSQKLYPTPIFWTTGTCHSQPRSARICQNTDDLWTLPLYIKFQKGTCVSSSGLLRAQSSPTKRPTAWTHPLMTDSEIEMDQATSPTIRPLACCWFQDLNRHQLQLVKHHALQNLATFDLPSSLQTEDRLSWNVETEKPTRSATVKIHQ